MSMDYIRRVLSLAHAESSESLVLISNIPQLIMIGNTYVVNIADCKLKGAPVSNAVGAKIRLRAGITKP